MVTRNYRATVAYDGTEYSGFQIQPQRRTIQGELEKALQRITQEPVRVNGAGRTDAGVHASGQVVNIRTSWAHGSEALQRAWNAVLPHSIAVRDVAPVDADFHARFSASSRSYLYNIHISAVRVPLLERFSCHRDQPLDRELMAEAADALVGVHDFAAFGQAPYGENTVRRVLHCAWRSQPAGEACLDPEGGERLQFEIQADAFLRGMVRRIVGTLMAVGLHGLTVADLQSILASRDISRASPPALACGLCLWRVHYDPRRPREEWTESNLPSRQ